MDLRFEKKKGFVVRSRGTGSTLGEVGFLFFSSLDLAEQRVTIEQKKTGFEYYVCPATLHVNDNT